MKTNPIYYYVLALLVLVAYSSKAQDPKEILQRSYEKCRAIRSGYYEFLIFDEDRTGSDTIYNKSKCYFKKENNTKPLQFYKIEYRNGKYLRESIFDGENYSFTKSDDSVFVNIKYSEYPIIIKSKINREEFYSPFSDNSVSIIPHDSDLIDTNRIYSLIGEEQINNYDCYHIRVKINYDTVDAQLFTTLNEQSDYWISKTDYIPICYSQVAEIYEFPKNSFFYEKYELKDYRINQYNDTEELSKKSIIKKFKEIKYDPYTYPEILPKSIIAPNWELSSIDGNLVKLSDYKGKLVLLDFFSKNCGACFLSIPALTKLDAKFKDKGVKIIGVDKDDTVKKELIDFIKKNEIKYQILIDAEDVFKKYHITGVPKLFLIDSNGIIIERFDGYSVDLESNIEEEIIKHLK
jgi:peroxiredoxin